MASLLWLYACNFICASNLPWHCSIYFFFVGRWHHGWCHPCRKPVTFLQRWWTWFSLKAKPFVLILCCRWWWIQLYQYNYHYHYHAVHAIGNRFRLRMQLQYCNNNRFQNEHDFISIESTNSKNRIANNKIATKIPEINGNCSKKLVVRTLVQLLPYFLSRYENVCVLVWVYVWINGNGINPMHTEATQLCFPMEQNVETTQINIDAATENHFKLKRETEEGENNNNSKLVQRWTTGTRQMCTAIGSQ